jgi:hypothetical protein
MQTESFDIAIIPREKFSRLSGCLSSLVPVRDSAARVILFDVGYPASILHETAELRTALDVEVIRTKNFELANECLNYLCDIGTAPWILLIENDCELCGADIQSIITAADAEGFSVVQAEIFESDGVSVHYSPPSSYIAEIEGKIVHACIRTPRTGYPAIQQRRRVFHVEKHALLVKRDALASLGNFENFLVTRSHWDLSFRLFRAGFQIVLDPAFCVRFLSGALQPCDREYFYWRWNREKALRSNEYIQQKWKIENYHSSLAWLDEMLTAQLERDGRNDC